MTEELAVYIRSLYPNTSLRRISELVCEKYPEYVRETWGEPTYEGIKGIQLHGNDLVNEAALVLNNKPFFEDVYG